MLGLELHPELAVLGFVGLGSALLGLAVLGGRQAPLRSPWARAGPLALLLLAAAWGGLGQPPRVWLAPLSLAALWTLGRLALSPLPDQLGAALARLRRPPGLGLALLVAGGVLTLALLRGGGEAAPVAAAGDPESGAIAADLYGLRPVAGLRVVTDRGRPVQPSAWVVPRSWAPGTLARWEASLRAQFEPAGVLRLGPPGDDCNCHGWVFLVGRYWLAGADVLDILQDNGYGRLAVPRAGDLVVYRDKTGRITHSGVILVVAEGGTALVESKWGALGVFVHPADFPQYGTPQYYRSGRTGHQLHGLGGGFASSGAPPAPAASD
jgi:hypothetical protein